MVRVVVVLLAASVVSAAAADVGDGTAEVPLAELLRLYRAEASVERDQGTKPPVAGAIESVRLEGRLVEDGLEVTARFRLSILPGSGWVRLPLLRLDDATTITSVPSLPGAAIAVEAEWLVLVSNEPGTRELAVGFFREARREGERRSMVMAAPVAASTQLVLDLDEALFRLVDPSRIQRQGDRVVVFPEEGEIRLTWIELAAGREAREEPVVRPPIEPVVLAAHASGVSTLEGETTVRLRCDLRFDGRQEIAVRLPPDTELQRIFVDGRPVVVESTGGLVTIPVAPARAGDQGSVLELHLRSGRQPYHLAGVRTLLLPTLSWPVHELFVSLHLPEVFEYEWRGGSLAEVAEAPAVEFTVDLPTPGRRLALHQYLVGAHFPTVRLSYSIDLEGRYFDPTD